MKISRSNALTNTISDGTIMTNAWSFLHDELYGESKMTESLDDRISPSIARNDGPVGSSGDDIITFNTLNVSVPELPETPENNNGRWKYHEDVILKDIKDYVSGTYNSHYTSAEPGFKDIQTIDLMAAKDLASDFCQANILKYGSRYGDKDGKNKKDLLKVIHYAMLLLHFDDHYKVTKSDFPY